jgi:hypothetical protein
MRNGVNHCRRGERHPQGDVGQRQIAADDDHDRSSRRQASWPDNVLLTLAAGSFG